MKHLKFLAAVCCMLAVFAACEKNEPSDNTNGNGINTDQNGGNSNTDNSSGSVSSPTGTENGHGYVDLGLSVKWATCNVGATKPEEYGNYYAWGETETKTTYDGSTYKWGTATYNVDRWFLETLTKYNTRSYYGTIDNKTVLELADDAAHVNWGGAWRMPTEAELKELRENCAWKWTDNYNNTGIAGYIVTGFNSNSIFLPAAGYGSDDLGYAGHYGSYWTSSLVTDAPGDAWEVFFGSDGVFMYSGSMYNFDRICGQSVRPVL